ncbi:UDP-N-acetylmuramoyl-L-alanine--D-glutamate ligase [Hyphobacterium marinum]|uniref:UDP-N-acetylmuramoylalanine--D-glutamate ligase n=1 Tax=Hyphobacterium marinum TaxID=3116574 RepID=A0ABU7LYG9_9PROT|nr:UDP-N-acetylmuramoyl-L-alanine--D-glutamate ligase [Hyphobacterium sp. Y6023]MEE2566055.1 UDP-N-acetylmuramoyl-L-alanine--D-glutamate ligase [Hyphobacterium sp. Y6023]
MIPVRSFAGQHVAVFGLGRTGIATVKALLAGGATVSAWDENEDSRKSAEAAGIETEDLGRRDWGDVAALVLSPGIPLTHPKPHRMVELARAVGARVIGDIELFARELNALADDERPKVIGITGTNGKSTTTALIGHILKRCGRDARVGGNIGEAVLGLEPPRRGAIYVLELSSYQLDLTETLGCDVAMLLNIAPDHLDRHGDLDGYIAAKKRIFANQVKGNTAIVGVDDPHAQKICSAMMAANGRSVVPISSGRTLSRGVYAVGGKLHDSLSGHAEAVMDMATAPALPGRHNSQNAAAAYAAVRALGLEPRQIAAAIKSFPGLPHRLERAGERGNILYVNDSKATNADAAAQALGCYDDIYWIVGGQAKSDGIGALAPFFPRIAKAYLIGEAADAFAKTMGDAVAHETAGTLEAAVDLASRDAAAGGRKNPVILLSPACASFDQFKNYEHRGDMFKIYVKARIGEAREGAA